MSRSTLIAPAVAFALVALMTLALQPPPASARGSHRCPHAHGRPGRITTNEARQAVHCVLNKRRRDHGLGPLRLRRSVDRAAHRHTRYMRRHGCFLHECAGEAALDARLRRTGYLHSSLRSWSCGEDIAWAPGHRKSRPAQIVHAWMHSPPHRANILDGGFHDVGVGVEWGTPYGGNAGGIYTIDFGSRSG